jgi:hypothetical protein
MSFKLPELGGVVTGISQGRSIYEGYQLGWGIQFGGLKEKILNDPLYQDAFAVAQDRTVMSEENRMNLFLLLRFFLNRLGSGHIVEYGSYRGGSAIFIAYIATAVKYSYESIKPIMVDGGYIVFDDATVSSCIGATEVVEDVLIRRDGLNSEQIWPHYVFRAFKSGKA